MDLRRHNFGQTYEYRYDRILDVLSEEDYRLGKVLNADGYMLNAEVS